MSGNQKQQQTSLQNQATAKTRKNEQRIVRKINPEQMLSATETLRSEDVLAAQQQVGNQVVQRALDRKGRDQRVTDNQGNLNEDLTKQIQTKRGGGSPLPDSVKQEASKKLGRKFNDVRIHTDETANKLSRSVSARAFTIGKDIFFKDGVFSPSTSAGRETLIHELTHVVQQSGSKSPSGGKLKLGAPDTAMEKEAAHMGRKHATQVGSAASATGAVQRQEEEEELQMQEDEEEIQMQEDEEELQMQPDASSGGVIQRSLVSSLGDWYDKQRKKKASKIPDAPALPVKKPKTDAPGPVYGPKTETGSRKGSRYADLASARAGMGIGSDTQKASLKSIDEKQSKTFEDQTSDYKSKDKNFDKVTSRNKLMHTISNPTSKPEDIAAAKEKLDMLHKRTKTDKFKSFFKKGGSTKEYSAQAEKKREENIGNKKKSLQSAAEKGDDNAFQELKALNAQKKSETDKKEASKKPSAIGGLFKKGLGFLGSKLKGIAGEKIKDAKEHYTGKKEEEKKEEAKPAGLTVNVNSGAGAGGGGGGGGMAETISDLFQENKQLKAENAELKKKKEEVPVVN